MNVLIVDDEPIIRIGLRSMLDWRGAGLTLLGEAEDGEEALAILESQPVDLLVTDLLMPRMDGLELLRRIKDSGRDVGIVVLSCLDDFAWVKEAMKLGARDYILKPTMEPEQLLAVLEETRREMEGRRAERDRERQWRQELQQTKQAQLALRVQAALQQGWPDALLEAELFGDAARGLEPAASAADAPPGGSVRPLYSVLVAGEPASRLHEPDRDGLGCRCAVRLSPERLLLLCEAAPDTAASVLLPRLELAAAEPAGVDGWPGLPPADWFASADRAPLRDWSGLLQAMERHERRRQQRFYMAEPPRWMAELSLAEMPDGLSGAVQPAPPTAQEEAQLQPKSQMQLELQSQSQPQSQLQSQLESQPQLQSQSQLESKSQSPLQSQLESQLESQWQSQLESQWQSQPQSQLQSQLQLESQPQSQSQLQLQLESQSQLQSQSQLESKSQSRLLPLPIETRNDLLRAVSHGNAPGFRHHARELGAQLAAARRPLAEVTAFAAELLTLTLSYARHRGYRQLERLEALGEAVHPLLRRCGTIGQLQALLDAVYEDLASRPLGTEPETASAAASDRSASPFVRKALRFMQEQYHRNLSTADISEHVKLSRSYLSDLYSKETGESLSETLTNIRMEEAKKLLRAGELKIYEIAEAVGFPDAKTFTKVFKRVVGCSPKEYELSIISS
ncbi:response regulator [Paenibacillus koleovorans]|uniref:response regulator n=1 Tax=Paenibacillus koleovorans TaxID=121608 RepID=UPI0013E367F7|nr:response regulator [Paenibacillus koleovorans]